MDALERVVRAREILRDVTPLKSDCGRICGHACCGQDENGKGGMLLFPGEEALYRDHADFIVRRDESVAPDGAIVTCFGRCDREDRPLSCRFFPLRPTAGGKAVMDRRASWVCPLYEAGKAGLSPEFVSAAGEAAEILAGNEEHARFLAALRERILYETREEMLWGTEK